MPAAHRHLMLATALTLVPACSSGIGTSAAGGTAGLSGSSTTAGSAVSSGNAVHGGSANATANTLANPVTAANPSATTADAAAATADAGGSVADGRTTTTVQGLATQAAPTPAEVESLVSGDAANAVNGTVYVSLAHLASATGGTDDLEVYRFGVTKALNSLSIKPALGKLTAIDAAETVYRLQLADFSLTAANLSTIESVAGAATAVTMVGNSPLIKGDWLVYAVTRPEIYDQIMQLPNFIGATSSFGLPTLEGSLGVVDHSKSVYIVAPNSTVTFSTRVLERAAVTAGGQTDGYYWRTYDFLSSADPAAIAAGETSPAALASAIASNGQLVAGEMFFSLPNGLQGSMLSGFQQQHRIDAQSLVATDHNRKQDGLTHCVGGVPSCGYVVNGESCLTCHSAGININPKPSAVFNATPAQATALLQQDQGRFVKALRAMGFATVDVEPVNATLARYRADNNVTDARQQGSEVNPVVNLSSVFNR